MLVNNTQHKGAVVLPAPGPVETAPPATHPPSQEPKPCLGQLFFYNAEDTLEARDRSEIHCKKKSKGVNG